MFHVTRLDGVVAIRRDGEIRPNGNSASPFGKQDAYFRSKGYVSLFNYRDLEDEVLSLSLENCCPWQAAAYGIGIFFVSQSAHPRLITWSDELQQRSLGKMIVPHVEAGWPGPLGMEHVDHLWEITVT